MFECSEEESKEVADALDSKYAKVMQKLLDLGARLDSKNLASTNALGLVGSIGLPKIGRLIAQKLKGDGDLVNIINNANDEGLVSRQVVRFYLWQS